MIQAIVGFARRVLEHRAPAAATRGAGEFARLLEGPGHQGSPAAAVSPPPPAAQERAATALTELWPLLVRRVAWEGDGHRGCIRLELGAGSLSGATLLLRCEAGRVHVALSDPTGGNLDGWRSRIGARLLAAG